MRELGYVIGKNLVIEPRFADGNNARLAVLATQLVQLNVDVFRLPFNRVLPQKRRRPQSQWFLPEQEIRLRGVS